MGKERKHKDEHKKWLAILMKLITFLASIVRNNRNKQL